MVSASTRRSMDISIATYSFNQLRLIRMLKLPQEADIIFEIFSDVVYAVFEHSDAFDTHSKGKSGILLRVNTAIL